MKTWIIAIALFSSAAAALAQVEPPQLQHANLVRRNATDLAAEVRRIARDKQPAWIAYSAPSVAPDHQLCCFNSSDGGNACGCTLERHQNGNFIGRTVGAGTQHLEPRPYCYVFLRSEA